MGQGTGISYFIKLSQTSSLKVLIVKNVKLNVQNLDELTISLLLLTINSEYYFLNTFDGLWDNTAVYLCLPSFSQIVVYVIMERHYMVKFALILYGILVLGNMFTTFFISYRISLLFECILQCLNSCLFNRVFLNSPLTS